MKKILLIIVILFCNCCSHAPFATKSMTDNILKSTTINNLHYFFIDSRESQFKTERWFIDHTIFPTIYSCGDAMFDTPLNDVFIKMFLSHFPGNPEGYKTEIKIRKYYFTWKPHELAAIPIINFFVIAADIEFHGILKMEVAILDKNEKFIFTKIYETDLKEMISPSNKNVYNDGMDILRKVFLTVMDEYEIDIKRIKFGQ
jgi:hypothetical protein